MFTILITILQVLAEVKASVKDGFAGIANRMEKIMAEIDDMKAALADLGTKVTDLGTATTAEFSAINTKLGSLPINPAGFIDPADIVPITAQITGISTNVAAITKQISDEAAALAGPAPATT